MHKSVSELLKNQYNSFFLIAGPCAVESYEVCYEVAAVLKDITSSLGIPFVFKASIVKANRTRLDSFATIGEEAALSILSRIKQELSIAITTDVHEITDIDKVKSYIDIIQIPAFLCRQTFLLQAAGQSGLPVNIKKGQFMDASGMGYAAEKVINSGKSSVIITERGNSFGYGELIVDMTNIYKMKKQNLNVVMDCTHATQRPNNDQGITGGNPEYTETLARAALSAGANGLFLETHPNPELALSDGSNMIDLDSVKTLIERLHSFSLAIKNVS